MPNKFNPLLKSQFQKREPYISAYIIYKKGTTIIAEPSSETGYTKFTGTDLGTVINNCIGEVSSGSRIHIRRGNYSQTTGINITKSIELSGEGKAGTLILPTGNIDCITVGDGVTILYNVYLHDFYIWRTLNPSAGTSIKLKYVGNSSFARITIEKAFYGIDIYDGSILDFQDIMIGNTVPYNNDANKLTRGIWIRGNTALDVSTDLRFKNVHVINSAGTYAFDTQPLHGWLVEHVGGLYLTDCETFGAGIGLCFRPGLHTANGIVKYIFIENCQIDSGAGHGILLQTNDANSTIKSVFFSNSWSATNTGNGIFIVRVAGKGIIQDTTIIGSRFFNNTQAGIYLFGISEDTKIIGCSISGNDRNDTGVYTGIFLDTSCSNVNINGNRIGQMLNMANTQGYAIYGGGSNNNIEIIGNVVSGNKIGAINNGGGGWGTTVIIRDNPGYNPQPLSAPVVGPSPYTYTNNVSGCVEQVYFDLGATTANLDFIRGGVTTAFSFNPGTVHTLLLYPGDALKFTYTDVPTLHIIPM